MIKWGMPDLKVYTVNDLFSTQCAKERLFLFNILMGKVPLLAHPS